MCDPDDRRNTLGEDAEEFNEAWSELAETMIEELHLRYILRTYMVEIVAIVYFFMGMLLGYAIWGPAP